jgi:hypothetical protein
MTKPDPTPHTPWLQEPAPWVPEPTPTGRMILRLWIEEQLRLVAAARERRSISRWARHAAKKGTGAQADGAGARQVRQRKSRHFRAGGGGAAGADRSSSHSPLSPPAM